MTELTPFPIYHFHQLPASLQDVVSRVLDGGNVYGFEFELLGDYVSQ